MSNDGKPISCRRSDTGLVRHFNLAVNPELTNTTEQIDFSDTTSPEFSDTTESGTTWKYKDTTESGNTSIFSDTTEGSNTSKSEDAYSKFRSRSINDAELTQSAEGKLLIDCTNPETSCVTVRCSLHGPIGSMSRPYVSFSMSATAEDLGEFTSPYSVGKVRLP
jgi:hypothetical protein